MTRLATLAATVALLLTGLTGLAATPASAAPSSGVNDPTCRPSATHPNPVVFLHGLGATRDSDIDQLQGFVAAKGYCTYSVTYGEYAGFPYMGGLKPIAESAAEIRGFVDEVLAQTGAAQVDLVGHSEGGFQTLYVTKTQGISDRIGRVVAIAPPTHGTTFGGLYDLAYVLGDESRAVVDTVLRTVGCAACSELGPDGAAVKVLTDGPIAQPGVAYTIITSRYDQMVTPTETSFVREPGVVNRYVQDLCPLDPVGHLGEAYDMNVWNMVSNALDPANARPFACTFGAPF